MSNIKRQAVKKFDISQVSKWLKRLNEHHRKKMKIPDILNGKS